ncbi:hypothetical protein [Enterococcus hermanniensis]|uniref:Uncharacterized protein n=1 Tax=Enterococcus hermanniensis TaxID=249189 RepID=A0A1L8TQA7_9ENTE|nr:hypothetical protein [Enterococcus hermanniensis]OJG46413.1 hypothetical protein RV04_GL000841 [Enterococcus hermanniensis]
MKTEQELSTITLKKHGKTYSYLNSHHYNWFKAIDLNLLNSDGFTNYFLRIKKNEPIIFETLQTMVQQSLIIAFQHDLSDADTFVLLTVAWAHGFVPENSAAAVYDLDRFLTDYTIQKDPLFGLNQMNTDFNQVLLQHFPKVRRQDLRLIYRLLSLKDAKAAKIDEELTTLNEPTRKRTELLLNL